MACLFASTDFACLLKCYRLEKECRKRPKLNKAYKSVYRDEAVWSRWDSNVKKCKRWAEWGTKVRQKEDDPPSDIRSRDSGISSTKITDPNTSSDSEEISTDDAGCQRMEPAGTDVAMYRCDFCKFQAYSTEVAFATHIVSTHV